MILEQVLLEKGNDLWEVFWQPAPPGAFEEKKLSYRPVQSDIQTPVPESKCSSRGTHYLTINSYLASSAFCHLLITFSNSLDPDQDRHNQDRVTLCIPERIF